MGADAESTVRRLSERLGCRLLLLPVAGETAWAFRPDRFLDRRPVPSEWFPFGSGARLIAAPR